jgi:hypothetical protein
MSITTLQKNKFNHLKSLLLFALVLLLFIACETSQKTMPTYTAVMQHSGGKARIDQEAFNRGRAIAITDCASCHRHFYPGEYTPDEWESIIKSMSKRTSLDAEQTEDTVLFFKTSSHIK